MRILCVGDSNTWGYDPVDGFRHKDMWDRFNVPKVLIVSPIIIRDEMVTKGGVFAGEFDETSVRESKLLAGEIKAVCDRYQLDFMDASLYAEASLVDNLHMDEGNHIKLGQAINDKLRNAK